MILSTPLVNLTALAVTVLAVTALGITERDNMSTRDSDMAFASNEIATEAATAMHEARYSDSIGSDRTGLFALPSTTRWVVGGTQLSQSGTGGGHFTQVNAAFTVPPTPTSGNANAIIAIWPGLESSDGHWLFQPVLEYNQGGNAHWQMHNYVVGPPGSNKGTSDTPQNVKAGDMIYASVQLDTNNLGGCSLVLGTNCNYTVFWWDETTNQYSELPDFASPEALNYAQGLIFEAPGTTYTSCNDFPAKSLTATVTAYEWTTANIFTDTTNMVFDVPGDPAGDGFNYPVFKNGHTGYCQFGASINKSRDQVNLFFNP